MGAQNNLLEQANVPVPPQYCSHCVERESSSIISTMEPKMDSWPGYTSQADALPQTLRFCKVCRKETTHEIRSGAGLTAKMCVICLETGRRYKLDRD